MIKALAWSLFLCTALLATTANAQSERDTPSPSLKTRPRTTPAAPAQRKRMDLDVVVQDAQGHPAAGLEPWDLKLFDNGKPTRILFFREFNSVTKPAPPVEVILVIDEINLPFTQVSFVKQQLAKFFEQNDGHLAQPVSLMLLSNSGLRVQPAPTQDSKALLDTLRHVNVDIRTIDSAMGSLGMIERLQRSVRQLQAITINEAQKPGRKLLIWIGPGWPMLDSIHFAPADDTTQKRYFQAIVSLNNGLRKARISLYSVSSIAPNINWQLVYKSFLAGVPTWRQAYAGNLALKVLVTQTGGLILGPDNDLTGQINQCIDHANDFYQVAFSAQPAEHPDELHELKLEVNRPGLTVRTTAAYYAEPPGN